jgi:hypothetical protein
MLTESGAAEFTGVPDRVASYCCASFLASRDGIRSRPLAMWERIDAWLASGKYGGGLDDKLAAMAMEHAWAFLILNATVA